MMKKFLEKRGQSIFHAIISNYEHKVRVNEKIFADIREGLFANSDILSGSYKTFATNVTFFE